MWATLRDDLRGCADVQSALNCVLVRSLDLAATFLGNVQLMDWKSNCLRIEAQRGFEAEFLNFFRCVELGHGSACARALHSRTTIAVEDIMTDPDFAPYREIAGRAGVRAVECFPLVSTSGALVGVLSNHFTIVQRLTDLQRRGLEEAAELAANAIIRLRANDHVGHIESSLVSLEESYDALDRAEKVLWRARQPAIGARWALAVPRRA
jgi:GAF domain-containing protein